MDHRSPLQHLLHNLLPARGRGPSATAAPDFADTRPANAHAAAVQASRRRALLDEQRSIGWSVSAVELAAGTDIMEYPDDTAADLMDEYFAKSDQRRRAA